MRRTLVFLVPMAFLFLFPSHVGADSQYFEFKPDYGNSILVASSPQPVEQLFLPLNDHLSGLDVWLSNGDTPGDVTFQLYGPNDLLLSSRTLSVPAIPDSTGGTRFKIPLTSQIPVTANQTYFFRMTTTVPTLRLYHAAQRTILAHNAEPQAAYTGGLARLGGQEQTFAFLFGLYEDTESTAPVLSNLQATVVSVQNVRIDLNASEPVDISVQYGPQGGTAYAHPYSGQYTSCPAGVQPCSVMLDIHDPGMPHDFTLTARDAWGNTVQVNGTFTSAGISVSPTPTPVPSATPTPVATPDTVPPVITNERAAVITHDAVTIAWTTDEAATSLVVIRFGIDQITVGGNSDSTLELEHAVTVPGLTQLTPYAADIKSADASGNETSTSVTFTTTKAPVPTPGISPSPTPAPANPTPAPTVSVGPATDDETAQEASWAEPDTGPPSGGYRIDIIGADGTLIRTIRTNDTSANLGALPDGARVIVYADHGDGLYEKVAAPGTVTRTKPFLEQILTNLPYVIAGAGIVLIAGALLWRTFRPAAPQPVPENPEPLASDEFTAHR